MIEVKICIGIGASPHSNPMKIFVPACSRLFCLMNTSFNLILFYGEDSDEIGTLRPCYVT